ncbi:MAG: hypothetical protein J7M25_16480 [Deltaproteobacteria bacterium]|nr:hypothetical protein [Deltaproteobacteria bacterium]
MPSDPIRRLLAQARAKHLKPSLLQVASNLSQSARPRWGLDALEGRLVEITGHTARLALAMSLVFEAQTHSEPVGWVTCGATSFYPPDAAAVGVDLRALAVIRAQTIPAAFRAAEILSESGGFGLVVLDLGQATFETGYRGAASLQRLQGYARRHGTAVVLLTDDQRLASRNNAGKSTDGRRNADRDHTSRRALPDAPISLRVSSHVEQRTLRSWSVVIRPLRDRRQAPTWNHGLSLALVPGLQGPPRGQMSKTS